MKVKVEFETDCCDDCRFYYYSDLRDVSILLGEEIPYEEAIETININCPFLQGKRRYTVYWNQTKIVVWDLMTKQAVCRTDEVTELQKENFRIIAWLLNKR